MDYLFYEFFLQTTILKRVISKSYASVQGQHEEKMVAKKRFKKKQAVKSEKPQRKPTRIQTKPDVIAALDLGTNNCRLLIAKSDPTGFQVIDGFSRIIRLGEGLSNKGELTEEAMDRTYDALSVCRRKVIKQGVMHGRYVATEACRQAKNAYNFLKKVEEEIGIWVEIIPSQEEAKLTFLGCIPLLDPKIPFALMFDVGGGSAEFLWVKMKGGNPEILGWISLPCGVVPITEKYGFPEIKPEAYQRIVKDIQALLHPFDKEFKISQTLSKGDAQILGTAGTVTTISAIQMGLKKYSRNRVDGSWLKFSDVYLICEDLLFATLDQRAAYTCIGHGRAELIVAGCAILESICKTWSSHRLRVADRGLREGILVELSDLVLHLH